MLPEFQNPPKQFRPSPFWSWNDDLKDEELIRQVIEFKEKGFGGYFMHSRGGLRTKYLGKDWMKRIAACLKEGKKLDMESWLYDEDRWPSGAAGGLVTKGRDEFTSRGLVLVRPPSEDKDYLAVFDLDEKSGTYRMIDPGAEAKNEKIAFEIVLAPRTNWFNGESYADLLNPEAVRAFLNITYEAYAEEFSADFGEFMPGIFTDEPHIRCGDLPWTEKFPRYFESLNGYDVISHLPDLFFDLESSPKTRYDFWRTATKMFVETFSKALYDWCEAHHAALTGHYLREDNLLSQMLHAGAAMPHYEFQHCPGIDHLGRNISNPLTLKQVSSVAHQLDRRRVLCEIYGVGGHSMSFEDQKWIADFHFALGINFICQHLVLYSMKGERKRDYPPTISYHQPYWEYYRYMNDYLARCCYAISVGKSAADILLLHPMPTAWAVWRKGNDDLVNGYNQRFVNLLTLLLESHRSFDLGDELIIERHAVVKGRTFQVGQMKYGVVVVPPSRNWGRAVLDLLKRFRGPIVFIGEIPTMVDGERSSEWKGLLEKDNAFLLEEDRDKIASLLDELIPRDISIIDETGQEIRDILAYHRISDGGHLYFLANTSRTKHHAATVRFAAHGKVNEWNPSDGIVRECESTLSGRTVAVMLDFPPAGSRILTVEPVCRGQKPPKLEKLERFPIKGPWCFRRTHPNSVTLDFCRLSINNAPFGELQPVWKARREIQKFFGLDKYQGIQPWVLDDRKIKLDKENSVKLQFEFEVESRPLTIHIVLEEGFKFDVKVNGIQVETSTAEWHWDRRFSRVNIFDRVLEGTNTVELECAYQWDTEIEEIYLVGEFGVLARGDQRFTIVKEPAMLERGDWTTQGYPFYSGNMIYRAQLEVAKRKDRTYFLDLSNVKCSLCGGGVNGHEVGLVGWHPWRLDVTRFLRTGDNCVEVEVVSTLRNTMGPLHHKAKDALPWVGPEQFVDQANWTDEYHFAPYGIFGDLELVVCREAESPRNLEKRQRGQR
jgi:hypothetical protein